MKKKCISLLLAACMLTTTPITANAAMSDDEFSYLSTYDDGVADCELEYFQNSSYVVKIPLRINNITGEGYTFTAQSIDILDNEVVRVYTENPNVTMTNERGDTCTLTLSSDGTNGEMGSFRNGESTSTVHMTGRMEMGARAGSYTGTATFSVRLENMRQ